MSMMPSGLMSSLAANIMAPTASQMGMGLAGLYDQGQEDQRRRPSPGPTARPMTPGMGTPLTQHIIQASQQPQPMQQQQVPQPHPQVQGMPREQDFNPAGVTLGEQEGGGRNVELIRGGHSEVQHFNAQGDNTGVLPPAGSANASLPALAKGLGFTDEQTATFQHAVDSGMKPHEAATLIQGQMKAGGADSGKGAMSLEKADKGTYDDLIRQANHFETLATHTFNSKDKQKFLDQATQLHNQATPIAQRMYHPNAQQNYQTLFDQQQQERQAGARNKASDASNAKLAIDPGQYAPLTPDESGYQPADANAQRASSPVFQKYARQQKDQQQQLVTKATQMGIPPAPEKGARLTAPQAATLRKLHPNPATVQQIAQSLGYDVTPGPFAEEKEENPLSKPIVFGDAGI